MEGINDTAGHDGQRKIDQAERGNISRYRIPRVRLPPIQPVQVMAVSEDEVEEGSVTTTMSSKEIQHNNARSNTQMASRAPRVRLPPTPSPEKRSAEPERAELPDTAHQKPAMPIFNFNFSSAEDKRAQRAPGWPMLVPKGKGKARKAMLARTTPSYSYQFGKFPMYAFWGSSLVDAESDNHPVSTTATPVHVDSNSETSNNSTPGKLDQTSTTPASTTCDDKQSAENTTPQKKATSESNEIETSHLRQELETQTKRIQQLESELLEKEELSTSQGAALRAAEEKAEVMTAKAAEVGNMVDVLKLLVDSMTRELQQGKDILKAKQELWASQEDALRREEQKVLALARSEGELNAQIAELTRLVKHLGDEVQQGKDALKAKDELYVSQVEALGREKERVAALTKAENELRMQVGGLKGNVEGLTHELGQMREQMNSKNRQKGIRQRFWEGAKE